LIEIHYPPSLASHISLQPEANSKSLVKLLKNEVVEGRVLKSLSLGEVLLLIKGRKVMAKTLVPLSEGKILSLKVEELLPKPTLKLLGIKFTHSNAVNISSILSAIKENLWKSTFENINQHGLPKEALILFRELMNDMSLRLFLESSPELLRAFIDQSGLSWEAKLRKALMNKTIGRDHLDKLLEGDLKGLVSKFLTQKGEDSVPLKRLVSTIKNIQLLNHFGLEQDRKIFLPIPIQFPDGLFTVGQLLIHLPQREKDESKTKKTDKNLFRITFLLELSHLGPLRADLTIKGKEIEAKFLLAREEARLLVEKSMPIFLNSMRETGFSIHHVEVHLKEPEVINQSLLKEIVQEEGNTISLVA
jgi:hypothetical protein